jgi:hypothetical protein
MNARADVDNLRSVAVCPLQEPGEVPGWLIEMRVDEKLRRVNPNDITDALTDDARFAALLQQADATLLGLHVLSVRREYAKALAVRELEAA